MEIDTGTNITNPEPLKILLNELKQEPCAVSFLSPVEWRLLGLSNYPTIVKRPMDITTLEVSKLLIYYVAKFAEQPDCHFRVVPQ